MKYYRYLFYFILPVFLACSSDPVDTTGTIAGIVKDAVTNANLQGATVTLEGGSSVITGVDGRYQFNDVEMGTYKVSVSRNDYLPDERTVSVKVREISNVDFSLRPAGSLLEVTPLMLDFDASDASLTIDIKNVGQATMKWQIVEDVNWLSCQPSSGSIYSGRQATVTLSVNRSGLQKGSYSGNVLVTSTDGGSETVRVSMSVSGSSVSLPQVSLLGVDGVTDVAASFSGTIVSIGTSRVTSHGFCWDQSPHPSLEQGSHRDLGATDEPCNFSYSVSGLSPNKTYYVRAYATNAEGTVYSSAEKRFTTTATPQRPQVETGTVSQVAPTSAQVVGNILDLGHESGVTQHGHVWSNETKEPTVEYAKTELGATWQTGSFTSTLTNLRPGTVYYVRAYARNKYGISYGNTVQLTTPVGKVQLTTKAVSNIEYNHATGGGRVTDLQGNTIKECGICWDTSINPTLAHNHAASSEKINDFSVQLTGLTEQTTYHVRAYLMTVSGETYYGQDVEFKTSQNMTLPTLSKVSFFNVTENSVSFTATVASIGNGTLLSAGFCYALHHDPTITDQVLDCGAITYLQATASALSSATTYYVRAFAENEKGIAYSSEVTIITKANLDDTIIDLDDYDADENWN